MPGAPEPTDDGERRPPSRAVTVVIPARNAAATLGAQLQALAAEPPGVDFAVVVVDNGSTDGTGDVARRFPASRFPVHVVREERPGVNVARNAGVAAARTEVVLLCDADDEALPGWVGALASAVDAGHWAAGVVDYALLNSERTRLQWGAPSRSHTAESDAEPYTERTFGGNCGFLRTMWEDVGMFDEALSGGGDETEFFARAHGHGWRRRWVPDAVVAYRLRPGLRNMCRQRFRQGREQVRLDGRSGGKAGPPIPSTRRTLLSLVRLLAASPRYLPSARRRAEWLGAACRHLGRLRGRFLVRRAS